MQYCESVWDYLFLLSWTVTAERRMQSGWVITEEGLSVLVSFVMLSRPDLWFGEVLSNRSMGGATPSQAAEAPPV